jgi:hypothetical protein
MQLPIAQVIDSDGEPQSVILCDGDSNIVSRLDKVRLSATNEVATYSQVYWTNTTYECSNICVTINDQQSPYYDISGSSYASPVEIYYTATTDVEFVIGWSSEDSANGNFYVMPPLHSLTDLEL